MFQKTFDAKVKKYNEFYERFKSTPVVGVDLSTINPSNKELIYSTSMKMVHSVMKGNVTPEVFCAAASVIFDASNTPYKRYCGFALPRDVVEYDKNITQFENMKSEGKEHPIFANHLYLEVDGMTYDLFKNTLNEDVDHVDCIEF